MNNDLLVSISPETPSWGLLRVPKTWTLGAPGSEQMLFFHFFLVVSGVIVKGMLPSTFLAGGGTWPKHFKVIFGKSDKQLIPSLSVQSEFSYSQAKLL